MSQNNLLTLDRFEFGPDFSWTIAKLFIQDKQDGFVIEDRVRSSGVKIKGETAIPFGRYPLSYRTSPKFSKNFLWSKEAQRLIPNPEFESRLFGSDKEFAALRNKYKDWQPHHLIWITDVSNFQFILIHWGNFTTDTEGCLIVGQSEGFINKRRAVLDSKKHYLKIYSLIYTQLLGSTKQYINII